MCKKCILISLVLAGALVITVIVLRFVVGGPEDTWICDGGEWVKHGNPASSKPPDGCKLVSE